MFAALTQIDILLIGAILGTSAVGIFQAPAKLITFLHYPGLALSAGVSPRLARGATAANVAAFSAGIRYLMVLQGLLVVPTIVWAGPITDLVLGEEFAESAQVMRALAPLTFLFGIAPIVSVAVNYMGEARRRIPIAIAALVANCIVSVVLLYEIGVVGSAIGADVAYLIYVPGPLLDLQAPDRPAGPAGGDHVRAHARCRGRDGARDAGLRLQRAVPAGLVCGRRRGGRRLLCRPAG